MKKKNLPCNESALDIAMSKHCCEDQIFYKCDEKPTQCLKSDKDDFTLDCNDNYKKDCKKDCNNNCNDNCKKDCKKNTNTNCIDDPEKLFELFDKSFICDIDNSDEMFENKNKKSNIANVYEFVVFFGEITLSIFTLGAVIIFIL